MPVTKIHSHLCPDCNLLWRCECDEGWKVQHVTCGCLVEIPEAIDPKEIPF